MTAIPAIYGALSAEAIAAYVRWQTALVERADHALDCRECAEPWPACGTGAKLHEDEQRAWSAWYTARTGRTP